MWQTKRTGSWRISVEAGVGLGGVTGGSGGEYDSSYGELKIHLKILLHNF